LPYPEHGQKPHLASHHNEEPEGASDGPHDGEEVKESPYPEVRAGIDEAQG
jgi:hypothetical protein